MVLLIILLAIKPMNHTECSWEQHQSLVSSALIHSLQMRIRLTQCWSCVCLSSVTSLLLLLNYFDKICCERFILEVLGNVILEFKPIFTDALQRKMSLHTGLIKHLALYFSLKPTLWRAMYKVKWTFTFMNSHYTCLHLDVKSESVNITEVTSMQ